MPHDVKDSLIALSKITTGLMFMHYGFSQLFPTKPKRDHDSLSIRIADGVSSGLKLVGGLLITISGAIQLNNGATTSG